MFVHGFSLTNVSEVKLFPLVDVFLARKIHEGKLYSGKVCMLYILGEDDDLTIEAFYTL